jgi:uncharacterized protein YdhG (YjbR/CyaY superfamily)
MDERQRDVTTIDDYINTFPPHIQTLLQQLRTIIHEAAPQATETISYHMPAFKQHGIIVYFAAAKNHIGLYPKATGITAFKDQLKDYETSKGTIRFPLDKPLPTHLIKKIVTHNLKENLTKH